MVSRGLLPVRRRGDHLGWSTSGVGSAAAFESADRPDDHVLVAEYLARQTHAGQAPSLKPRFFRACYLCRFSVDELHAGMSRPLLKFGGGSVEILRDVLH